MLRRKKLYYVKILQLFHFKIFKIYLKLMIINEKKINGLKY